MNEPERAMTIDLVRLAAFQRPMLITQGDQSPPFFAAILDKIATIGVPQAERYTFRGAGHVPHITNADEYVRVVTTFVQRGTLTAAS
jgi:pimeloyl-ACP methyl ester carboxylesterase